MKVWPLITPEALATVIVAGCAVVLTAALIAEHAFGMAPCPLCLMQRIWFFLTGAIALAGLAHNPAIAAYPIATFTACAAGGGFAIRQLWLQSLPADQVPACGPGLDYMIDVFPFSEVLRAMTMGTGDCAEVVWQFGLTLPGWSLATFTGLAAIAAAQLWTRRFL